MLNCNLTHEFRTHVCCYIGATRASAEALRKALSTRQLPLEYEAEIQRIENHLGVLLAEFNRLADDYNGEVPIDLELAALHFQHGIQEWRGCLDRLLTIMDNVLAAVPGKDDREVWSTIATLQRLQHLRLKTLTEILERSNGNA
ncbi:MAG: hypothetical protein JNM56_17825 [Planctomycetia bacterium]|nr:hypothetical protein [Planctomycetia bacterium]